jgi:hypothetical protein
MIEFIQKVMIFSPNMGFFSKKGLERLAVVSRKDGPQTKKHEFYELQMGRELRKD